MALLLDYALLSSWIAEGDCESITEYLVEYKTFPQQRIQGYELVCQAISRIDRRNIAKLLIEQGFVCNPVDKTTSHSTPLHYAVMNNDLEMVNLLLDKSVDVNIFDENRQTPLFIAINNENIEITQCLFEQKVDLDLKYDDDSYNIQYLILLKNNKQIIDMFKNKFEYDFSKDRVTLLCALKHKNCDVIKKLLEFGATIDIISENEAFYGLINLAYHSKNKDMMETVVQIMTINEDLFKESASRACKKKGLKCRNRYLCKKNHIERYSGRYFSSISLTLENDDTECTFLLNDFHNHHYESRSDGIIRWSPFKYVIDKGYKEIIQIILDKLSESAVNFGNDQLLLKAFNHATDKKNREIIKLFESFESKRLNYLVDNNLANIILSQYSERRVVQFLQELWEEHKKPALNSILMCATRTSRKKLADEALTYGADPNFKDENGNTALHIAVAENSSGVIPILLECGADINSTNANGKTPLQCAIQLKYSECISILTDFDANIFEENSGDGGGGGSDEEGNNDNPFNIISNLIASDDVAPYTSNSTLREVYLKYILKRHYANLYVNDKLYEIASTHEKSPPIIQKILDEINSMKVPKVDDSNLSIYNIFKSLKDIHRLTKYIENPDLEYALDTFNWNSFFPMYSNIFKNSFIKAKQRKFLLEELNNYLDFNLPFICLNKIINYLNDDDLKILIKAYKNK